MTIIQARVEFNIKVVGEIVRLRDPTLNQSSALVKLAWRQHKRKTFFAFDNRKKPILHSWHPFKIRTTKKMGFCCYCDLLWDVSDGEVWYFRRKRKRAHVVRWRKGSTIWVILKAGYILPTDGCVSDFKIEDYEGI